jgi:hypothetical protein
MFFLSISEDEMFFIIDHIVLPMLGDSKYGILLQIRYTNWL